MIGQGAISQDIQSYSAAPISVGARGGALGYALIAEGYDVGNMYLNPASLAFVQTMNILLDHRLDQLDHVFHESATSPVWLSSDHSLGVGALYSHTRASGSGGALSFSQFGVEIGYAYRISPEFSVGILLSGRFGTVQRSSRLAGWVSVGMMYSPSPAISYGFTFKGLGGVGLNYSLSEDGSRTMIGVERQVPQSIEIGSIMRYPSTRPFIRVAVSGERLSQGASQGGAIGGVGVFRFTTGTVGYRYKGGIELGPIAFLAMRLGYVRDAVGRGQVGFGIYLKSIQANFGIQPSQKQGQFYEVSLSIALGGATIPW